MKCPNCPDVTLVISERSGIEIDYCPTCRGVWLDRGELDKLIERAAVAPSNVLGPQSPASSIPPSNPLAAPVHYPHRKPDDSHDGYPSPYPKRKKSWLSEIFD